MGGYMKRRGWPTLMLGIAMGLILAFWLGQQRTEPTPAGAPHRYALSVTASVCSANQSCQLRLPGQILAGAAS